MPQTAIRRRTVLTAALLLPLATSAQTPTAPGEITKIDKATAKLTIKHGELKHLDMPPMTMVFRVADAKMLEGLAVGQRIRFAAERVDGQYTVTSISKAP